MGVSWPHSSTPTLTVSVANTVRSRRGTVAPAVPMAPGDHVPGGVAGREGETGGLDLLEGTPPEPRRHDPDRWPIGASCS